MAMIDKNTVSAIHQLSRNMAVFGDNGGTGKRILIIGNSITRHGPKADIGWEHDWGMAASCPEKDYAHLLMGKIHAVQPEANVLVVQLSDWERTYSNPSSAARALIDTAAAFDADILVCRLGENTPREEFAAKPFAPEFDQLLRTICPHGTPVVGSCFWQCADVDEPMQQVVQAHPGWRYVFLGDLGEDKENRADGLFWHAGVAAHPGDTGMQRIADRLWVEVESLL